MRITNITVTYARTEQTKPYCSVKEEVTLTAELTEQDDPAACLDALQVQAREHVKAEILRATRNLPQQAWASFQHRPLDEQYATLETFVRTLPHEVLEKLATTATNGTPAPHGSGATYTPPEASAPTSGDGQEVA